MWEEIRPVVPWTQEFWCLCPPPRLFRWINYWPVNGTPFRWCLWRQLDTCISLNPPFISSIGISTSYCVSMSLIFASSLFQWGVIPKMFVNGSVFLFRMNLSTQASHGVNAYISPMAVTSTWPEKQQSFSTQFSNVISGKYGSLETITPAIFFLERRILSLNGGYSP